MTSRIIPKNPVFCAIDTPVLDAADKLAADLGGAAGGIKLGKEFFTAHGCDFWTAMSGYRPTDCL